MKNLNDNPCENCTATHCPVCDFFHSNNPEKDVSPNNEFDERHGSDLLLDVDDYEESAYLDPDWEDDDYQDNDDYQEISCYDEFDYYDEMWGRNARMAEKSSPDSSSDFTLGE